MYTWASICYCFIVVKDPYSNYFSHMFILSAKLKWLWYRKISRKIPPGLKFLNFSCNYIGVTVKVIHSWMKGGERQRDVLQAPLQNNHKDKLICHPDVCPSRILGLFWDLWIISVLEPFLLHKYEPSHCFFWILWCLANFKNYIYFFLIERQYK